MLSPPGGMAKSGSDDACTAAGRASTAPVELHRILDALDADPGAGEARQRAADQPVIDDLLQPRRIQDRDHRVDEGEFRLVRGGGAFAGVVVAHQRDHAAIRRRAVEIGVAERVAGAVDARPLAVPDARRRRRSGPRREAPPAASPTRTWPRGPRSAPAGRRCRWPSEARRARQSCRSSPPSGEPR